jgi:polar amino acid transport system substrate-binding protein
MDMRTELTGGAVVLAILDEPRFCWLAAGEATGCDVEVARHVLTAVGIREVTVEQVAFAELIPGLLQRRWQMTTGMFITAARRRLIRFSRPIWAVIDGLVVQAGDEQRFTSYRDVAADPWAPLAVVTEQVQGDRVRAAGLPADRLLIFGDQQQAVAAVIAGDADAAASTAIGNRAYLARLGDPALTAVDLVTGPEFGDDPPFGGYGFHPADIVLAHAVDHVLSGYLGSPEHRRLMTRYGFVRSELDAVDTDRRFR